ncbi:hypothetical protein BCR34DRAFT_158720 [Clohesyomyces aquaticus]|uniref:Uncharacterized protein n=1 Tax=Clohesyomyces aquaticus TaxID=1231657 RepID=A0A1Y1YIZ5_9PLEO|nr:hypothetical protein BCR34DRAFT_158720 [Clohesyomyces aquaticus]
MEIPQEHQSLSKEAQPSVKEKEISTLSSIRSFNSTLNPGSPYTTGGSTSTTKRVDPASPIQRRKIIVIGSIVAIPMIVCDCIILWIVFKNQVEASTCPYPELCHAKLNGTASSSYYYIDFPAARLAFVSSWSSTIAFSLVSLLMTLFSYTAAWQLVSYSKDTQKPPSFLPTPYQMTFLLRVMNAELLALTDLVQYRVEGLFSRIKGKTRRIHTTSKILQLAILVFLLGLLGSILIQGADTWLHIATISVNIVKLSAESQSAYQYGRGLAPWCFNRPLLGSKCNRNYWGCGIDCAVDDDGELKSYDLANMTTVYEVIAAKSSEHTVMNYTDADGLQFAIAAPAKVPSNIDWEAESFAVSTQCRAIPYSACDVDAQNTPVENPILHFNCSEERAGIDVAGDAYYWNQQMMYFDFHKYIHEKPAFSPTTLSGGPSPDGMETINTTAPNVTDSEANDVFRNPWHWIAAIAVYEDNDLLSSTQPDIWRAGWVYDLMMLLCNTTVWEVTYTSVDGQVQSMTSTMSNSSVAGIISMPSAYVWGNMGDAFSTAVDDANQAQSSTHDMVNAYSLAMSHRFVATLSGQLNERASPKVQRGDSLLITQTSKAAFWCLVLLNLLFALFGIILAGIALFISSVDVHQIQMRLSIAGLTAEVFEKAHSQKAAKSETDLFPENDKEPTTRRIGVRRTDTGGTVLSSSEKSGFEIEKV